MTRHLIVATLLASSVAAAQPAPEPPPPPPPSQAASFVTIDTLDGNSRVGLSIQYMKVSDKVGSSSPTFLRFVASARYVDPVSGAGGYIQLPFTYAHASGGGTSNTINDVGDLEAGAIYLPKLATPGIGIILHAGITAPTAEEGENESLVGLISSVPMLRDFYDQVPKGVTGRVGVSPTFHQGNFFLRGDFGFDWNFTAAKNTSVGQGVHFNLGAGFDLGKAAVMIESANLALLDEKTSAGTNKGTTVDTIAVSARADAGQILPYIAVIIPLDKDGSDIYDFAIIGGAEFKIM